MFEKIAGVRLIDEACPALARFPMLPPYHGRVRKSSLAPFVAQDSFLCYRNFASGLASGEASFSDVALLKRLRGCAAAGRGFR
jgi:hypothetical protein